MEFSSAAIQDQSNVRELYNRAVALFTQLGGGLTVGVMVAATVLATVFGFATLVMLPASHFVTGEPVIRRHPLLRGLLAVLRNLVGGVVLLMGLVMIVPLVPGPGLVFLLLGLSLVTFPGKRSLELKLLRLPSVNGFITRLRARFGRAPFELP